MGLSNPRDLDAPNYTQAPNVLLDDLLPVIDTLAELKVTLAIVRATFGWHKAEDCLSLSQLQARTGLSRQSVIDGTRAAVERKYVRRRKDGSAWVYWLAVKNLDSQESGLANGQASGLADEGAASQESGPTKEQQQGKKEQKENARPEVERLCQLMADLSNERTDPDRSRPKPKYEVTQTWRDEMRRLLDIDGRSEEMVERAIRWVDAHPFWASNVLSVPKLREKFDQLLLQAQREAGDARSGSTKADTVQSRVQALRGGSK